MDNKYVLALDASTTGVCAIVFGSDGQAIASVSEEITQYYPNPGWVEHDPIEIWTKQLCVARDAINKARLVAQQISCIGITNQRETTIIWDRVSGEPIHNAIVWQDRRTTEYCEKLAPEIADYVATNTGLVVDAYFSASKINWLLNNIPDARARANKGELAFGTVDSWLIWNLTNGKSHITDRTNASRTLVYNIKELSWDQHLLDKFDIPESLLPEVKRSSEYYAHTCEEHLGAQIDLCAAVGDQQASLFGQACFSKGMAKCSYGTSAVIMMNTGDVLAKPDSGLATTLAASIGDNPQYAVEGVIFNCGSAVQWLRDELQIISSTQEAVVSTENTNGVYFVPAFSGLLAPVWDPHARGAIVGLTRGANKAHLIRATLEALAFQVHDMAAAIADVSGLPLNYLRVDGGASTNDFVMQFQADITDVTIVRSSETESAARGAAFLAGLASGVWTDLPSLAKLYESEQEFKPRMPRSDAQARYKEWLKAVKRSLEWAKVD
ncbi:MAG: glycerol kinase GlpK [Granulosicoccus sp.]